MSAAIAGNSSGCSLYTPVLAGGIPIFFSRSAVTRDLFDLIVELRPHTTSGRVAETVKRKSHARAMLAVSGTDLFTYGRVAPAGVQAVRTGVPRRVQDPDIAVSSPRSGEDNENGYRSQ